MVIAARANNGVLFEAILLENPYEIMIFFVSYAQNLQN
jgi:hypothetical protein